MEDAAFSFAPPPPYLPKTDDVEGAGDLDEAREGGAEFAFPLCGGGAVRFAVDGLRACVAIGVFDGVE